MARTRATIGLAPLLAGMGELGDPDEVTVRLLDAGESLLRDFGLRRWSMEDVAERAGVGRTTLYRKFAARDDLVHAVLARELRVTIDAIARTAARHDTLEDKAIEGAMTALASVPASLVASLLRSDPVTFLPFLTAEAEPLLLMARDLLVAQARALGAPADDELIAGLAELAARLGLSFLLTPASSLDLADPEGSKEGLRRVLRPLLSALAGQPA
jgi:AcrR family transcriptional regulator